MKKQRIRMIVHVPGQKQPEEVLPENDVYPDLMIPIFLSRDGHYYTIPGQTAAMVWETWMKQYQ